MTWGKFLAAARTIVGAADVDVFEGIIQRHIWLAYRLVEGVEVAGDQVDGVDAVGGELRHVVWQVAAGQDTAVDFGVKRLHAAAETSPGSR